MPFEDGRVRHASLFYLEPTVSRVSEVSRVALRARLVLVRARDNACFNVFCHVGFFGAEMFRDVSPTSQATLDAVRAVFAQKQLLREDGSVDAARMRFEMQQTGAIYTSAFCWFAATNILLVRLAQLRGRVRFVPTTEIVTEGGGVTFEWVLREGELSAPWESEMLAARTDTFLRTGGLPLALEKREVAQGYIELEVARFVATQLLETQYGVSLARVSCFERFDQDQMIVRVQSLDPRATAEDVARLFVRAADQCAEMTRAFYKTYASTF